MPIETRYRELGLTWKDRVVNTPHAYIDGYFIGCSRNEVNGVPDLLGPEAAFINQIKSYMEHVPKVYAVDLGGMLSCSFAVIAAHLSHEIDTGKLVLVSTSKEPEASIANLLAEAQRRLDIYGSEEGWGIVFDKLIAANYTTNPDANQVNLESIILTDRIWINTSVLDFITSQAHRIHYIPNTDTIKLPQLSRGFGSHFHLIHEHVGGLFHHPQKWIALRSVYESLDPLGMLLTSHDLVQPSYFPEYEHFRDISTLVPEFKDYRVYQPQS